LCANMHVEGFCIKVYELYVVPSYVLDWKYSMVDL
jgi:hypothetical protein